MKEQKSRRWLLYILECSDGTFYTGISNDLPRRVEQHNAGRASRYTRSRRPVRLIHKEACTGRSAALRRECAIKALTRTEKEEYIKTRCTKISLAQRGAKYARRAKIKTSPRGTKKIRIKRFLP